jgi:hypothetical protein
MGYTSAVPASSASSTQLSKPPLDKTAILSKLFLSIARPIDQAPRRTARKVEHPNEMHEDFYEFMNT